MSGIQPPAAPFPGVSSPVQLPAPGMAALAEEGPLQFTARALQARLQSVFPASRFDFHYLDGKLDRKEWQRLTQRLPAIALGWMGVAPSEENGAAFDGHSRWFVALITKNIGGPQARLLGDKLAPGILSLVRAASIALNGFVIDPDNTPWAASGATRIASITPIYSDEWVDDAMAVAGIEITVPYEETLPPVWDTPNSLDAIAIDWNFQAAPTNPQFTTLTENAL